MAKPSLPWDRLKSDEAGIPWAEIRQFADALAADPEMLPPLLDRLHEAVADACDTAGYECLYLSAIVALAAPRLDERSRRTAARGIVKELVVAAEADEVTEESLVAAAGTLGAEAVVPAVLESTPADFQPYELMCSLCDLMTLAAKSENQLLRLRVTDYCVRALRRADNGFVDLEAVEPAARVLACLGHKESLPLLERLFEQSEFEEIQDSIDLLKGECKNKETYPWERPVETWLREEWEAVRDFYSEIEADLTDEEPLDGEEEDGPGDSDAGELDGEHEDGLTDDDAGPAPDEDVRSEPFVNKTPKVGRNDPCPCGSGKKYKKCCGR